VREIPDLLLRCRSSGALGEISLEKYNNLLYFFVRIIASSTPVRYVKRVGRSEAGSSLTAWYRMASEATWRTPNDVKSTLGNASIINRERVVFNIAGNKHRLIAAIDYQRQVLFVKFIGTHAEYDRVDAATVDAWE